MQHIIENWLPYTFVFLMGLSLVIYAVLDGYDLGVGMLIENANSHEKDLMIASIGPFWDANETWLILGVGLLLVAFPMAHGVILTNLYMPVAIMLFGLIFRGVAFDFRAKVPFQQKWRWNNKFFYGSLLTSLAQGYIMGSYIIGFKNSLSGIMFSCLISVVLASVYCLIGSCWLIMKCEGALQKKAVKWAKYHLVNSVVGLATISIATLLISDRMLDKWCNFPETLILIPIPIFICCLIVFLYLMLKKMPFPQDRYNWLPLIITVLIFVFTFLSLAYSFFPYIIPEQMTIIEAAAAPESLIVIFFGTIIILPILLSYTALSYYIFRGKASNLRYD